VQDQNFQCILSEVLTNNRTAPIKVFIIWHIGALGGLQWATKGELTYSVVEGELLKGVSDAERERRAHEAIDETGYLGMWEDAGEVEEELAMKLERLAESVLTNSPRSKIPPNRDMRSDIAPSIPKVPQGCLELEQVPRLRKQRGGNTTVMEEVFAARHRAG